MQKSEKSKMKNKDMSKESSNEKDEGELRKVADRMFNADMNHFQSDNYDENDLDVEPQIFAEHRDKDGNVYVEDDDEENENRKDNNIEELNFDTREEVISGENKNLGIDKNENLGQAKKTKKKEELKGKWKSIKSAKRRQKLATQIVITTREEKQRADEILTMRAQVKANCLR